MIAIGLHPAIPPGAQPVLDLQSGNPPEFELIIAHQHVPEGQGMRGNQQVVATDRAAAARKLGVQAA